MLSSNLYFHHCPDYGQSGVFCPRPSHEVVVDNEMIPYQTNWLVFKNFDSINTEISWDTGFVDE